MQAGFIASNNAQPFLSPSPLSGVFPSNSILSGLSTPDIRRKQLNDTDLISSKIRDSARQALNGTTPLTSNSDSNVFNARAAVSSNPDVVAGTAANGAASAIYNISVYQLAAGQSVVSDVLNVNDKITGTNAAGGGIFAFNVNLNNTEHRIEVNVSQSDTNATLLNKMADAVNNADIGLYATVNSNTYAQTVQLSVSGVQPGDMHSFTMSDAEGGSLLQSIGMSTGRDAVGQNGGLTQASSNAVFSVNGQMFISDTNTVALFDNSVEFTFKQRTDPTTNAQIYSDYFNNGGALPNVLGQSSLGAGGILGSYNATLDLGGGSAGVTVEVKPDVNKVAGGISTFVQAASGMANTLGQSAQSSFQALGGYMSSQFSQNANALSQMGIKAKGSSYNVYDQNKLTDKLQNDFSSVRNFFSGPGGLAQKTLFGIERAAYAPFAGISYVQTNLSSIIGITGFFHDSTI